MRGQYEPLPAPDPDLILNLRLKVRELLPDRPRRWAWDLIDSRDNRWYESMYEFDSAEDAERSARSRLAELTQSLPGTEPAARPRNAPQSQLIVVSAQDDEAFEQLKGLVGDKTGIDVIRDRRKPLAPMPPKSPERRSTNVSSLAQARGWWIVKRSRKSDSAESA